MPELPEVETVRKGLEQAMLGHSVEEISVRVPALRWPLPERMKECLRGKRVDALRRLGKYLLLDLSGGITLIAHLGMSGRFAVYPESSRREGEHSETIGGGKHDHVVIRMSDGTMIVYSDPRRFGMMDLVGTEEASSHRLLAGLGPEPLRNEFSDAYLRMRLAAKSAPIKSALLDQSNVAGLGNIYVCEVLWEAGVSPFKKASSAAADNSTAIVRSIRSVLDDAIAAGGSTLRDHRQVGGELGYFQHRFKAYGREGAACLRASCGGLIQRSVQSGRSTFHCLECQR